MDVKHHEVKATAILISAISMPFNKKHVVHSSKHLHSSEGYEATAVLIATVALSLIQGTVIHVNEKVLSE